MKVRLTLAVALLLALAATVGVFAYWTASATGTTAGSVATLDAPVITSATPGSGTVALTWSAITPPGSGTVSYSVQRNGGNASGDCPTAGSPTGVTTCTDSGLAAGTYGYTVIVRWRSWTATSAVSTVTVTSTAATHLVLAAATATPAAGAADNLTITAKDAGNTTVTGYTGDKSLTFSGASTIGSFQPTVTDKNGTAVSFGTAVTLTFSSGVATVSGSSNGVMRLYKAETTSIVVSDGSIDNGGGLAVTVTPGAATQIALTGSTASLQSGATRTATATIQDVAGNTVTSGADSSASVTFAQPSGAGSVTGLGASTASGGAATKVVTGNVAGAVNLQATATLTGGATSSNLLGFTVTVGAAAKLGFTQQPSGATGGVAFGTQPKVAIQDLGGNTVTSDTSSVSLALTTAAGATLTCTSNPLAAVSGVATFAGCKIDLANSYTLTATDGSLTSAVSSSITVTVGAAAKLGFTQQPSGATGGVAFGTQPKVAIQDLGGNTVTSDTSSVSLALTTAAGATLTCTSNPLAAVSGVATFAGCKIDLANSYTLTATDGSLTSAVSSSITITAPGTVTAYATGNWNAVDTWTALALTGTISSATTSTTVTGTGTLFQTQLSVGDRILRSDGITSIGLVQSVASNTSLTLTANASSANTAIAFTARRLPTVNDAVSVTGAFTVTITSGYAAVANSLTIGSSANATLQTITFTDATSSLTLSGDVTMSAPNGGATRNLPVNTGTLTVGGSLYLSAGASGNQNTGPVNGVSSGCRSAVDRL